MLKKKDLESFFLLLALNTNKVTEVCVPFCLFVCLFVLHKTIIIIHQ